MKQTKIVATISDLKCDVDFLRDLYEAGVNIIRINTAHATPEGMENIINNVRKVSPAIGVLIDTKGPEIRTMKTVTGEPIEYKGGSTVRITGNTEKLTTPEEIFISYTDIAKDVNVGNQMLFDDGALSITITKVEDGVIEATVDNDGKLGNRKTVNVPGVHIDLPSITEKDRKNIIFAIEHDIEFIAHSFVRSVEDVKAVQAILDEYNSDIKIISKIENQEGVDNIDSIIEASYGIMIARGDLGIEVPAYKIPGLQMRMIRKCVFANKPAIVATQMLHTMMENPRPTRAEVTDIATAIFNNTSAIMLSGETASGKYPVEAVKVMSAIAEQAEHDRRHEKILQVKHQEENDLRAFFSHAAIQTTERLGVKAILTDSGTGMTARYLSAWRGPRPVIAICYREKVMRQLSLSYGITPMHIPNVKDTQEMFIECVRDLHSKGHLKLDDRVAYLSGTLDGAGASVLSINKVDDVLNDPNFSISQIRTINDVVL